jgi:hypothetical protein
MNFLFHTADTICFIWNEMLSLFEKNSEDKVHNCISSSISGGRNKSSSTFTLNLEDEEKELIEHFLISSIDLIYSNHSILASITQQIPTSNSRRLSKTNEPKTFQVKKKQN